MLISLSSSSSRLMAWMIIVSTLSALNFSLYLRITYTLQEPPSKAVRKTQDHSVHVLVGNGTIRAVIWLRIPRISSLILLLLTHLMSSSSLIRPASFGSGHSQLVLQVRLHDGLLEELLQGVVQRAIDQGRSSGQSLLFTPRLETNLRRVIELFEVDQLHPKPMTSSLLSPTRMKQTRASRTPGR